MVSPHPPKLGNASMCSLMKMKSLTPRISCPYVSHLQMQLSVGANICSGFISSLNSVFKDAAVFNCRLECASFRGVTWGVLLNAGSHGQSPPCRSNKSLMHALQKGKVQKEFVLSAGSEVVLCPSAPHMSSPPGISY